MKSSEAPDANTIFQRHLRGAEDDDKQHPPPALLALGTLQWGTTPVDHRFVNGKRGALAESEAREIFETFASGGCALVDTAEGYGGGTSERRLGRLLNRTAEESSETVDVEGKDYDDTADTTADASLNDGATVTSGRVIVMTKFLPAPWRFTHAHFEEALRGSNERLGIDKCPIYLIHSPMHLYRNIEYWVESASLCKRKGLMEDLGLSNCSAEEVRRAVVAGKKFGVTVAVNQVHYSLLDYNSTALKQMQETCDELNVTIIGYNVLGQGLLTDNLTRERFNSNKPAKMMGISWEGELQPLRTALRRIANSHEVSMAQVALCWCRMHNAIPLVGCRSRQQAEDSLASLTLDLTEDEVATLDSLALERCTLDSPAWRRKLFVTLAGVVMVVCRLLDLSGVGADHVHI